MAGGSRTRTALPVLPGGGQSAPGDRSISGGRGKSPAGSDDSARASSEAVGQSAATVRVGMVTLGCDKNTVDSERIMGDLIGVGAEVKQGAEGADVVLINTCGFIDVAREESIDTILEAVRLKDDGGVRAVVAMGCLVQRYKAELADELPEVDLLLGLTEVDRLLPELRARGLLPDPEAIPVMERPLRVLSTDTPHTSHLKISEGCDHSCAFCAIPLMRGRHRSTPIDRLVREAAELESRGVVELNIVSQDTTWYGRDWIRAAAASKTSSRLSGMSGSAARDVADSGGAADASQAAEEAEASTAADAVGRPDADRYLIGKPFSRMAGLDLGDGPRPLVGVPPELAGLGPAELSARARRGMLPDLLRALLEGTSIPWLRLFYMYPSGITPGLVDLIAAEPRILPYLDMPIQHGSDRVLELMRRPERRSTIRERVGWLRAAVPDLSLRTTLIVGFPGETEDDFEELLDLLEEIRFDYVGAFPYSPEENTPAARLGGVVSPALRRERLERLLDVQAAITAERNQERIGAELEVLVDRESDPTRGVHAIGRSRGQAFEVDGVVYLRQTVVRTGGAEGAAGEEGAAVRAGERVRVRITEAEERDLVGTVIGRGGNHR